MAKDAIIEADMGDVNLVGLAHDAAQKCLKSVRFFLIASELPTGNGETLEYRQSVEEELESFGPFQSMVAPLCDALDFAHMAMSPAARLLPNHDDDTGARRIHAWSRNYFELAEFLAKDLHTCLQRVEPALLPDVEEAEIDEALSTWARHESSSRDDIRYEMRLARSPFRSIWDYRSSAFYSYIRGEWPFNGAGPIGVDYDALQARLYHEHHELQASLSQCAEEQAANRDTPASRQKRMESTADLIHPAEEEPPPKYRHNGRNIGPLTGSRKDLGSALHKGDVKDRQAQRHLEKLIREETVWARHCQSQGGKLEVFLTTFARLHEAETRLKK